MKTRQMPFQIILPCKTPLTTLNNAINIPPGILISRPNKPIYQTNLLNNFSDSRWCRLRMRQVMPLQNLLEPKSQPTSLKFTNERLHLIMHRPNVIFQTECLL